MNKNKYIKVISWITALTLTMSLIGCSSKKKNSDKFNFYKNNKGQIVAYSDSYIDNNYINSYYVIEVVNNITNKKEVYIARKDEIEDSTNKNTNYVYKNIFNNYMITYSNNYRDNYYLQLLNEIPLSYYINKYSMYKEKYSYQDIEILFNIIKDEYNLNNTKIRKRNLI